jgi:Flp pilus assembly protein TadG
MRCTRCPRTPSARDRGLATAETAVALPAIGLLVAGSLALPVALSAQLRATDAAREAARAAARGDPDPGVRTAAWAVAPGAVVSVGRDGGLVRVRVQLRVALPVVSRWSVSATAVAADEAVLP